MTPLHDTAVAMGYTTENNCVQSNDTVLDILNNEAIFCGSSQEHSLS